MKNLRKATKTPKRIKTKNNNSSMPLEWDKAIQEAKTAVKSLDKKIQKQSKGNVPASQQYDWLNNTSFNNIIYPKDKIPDRLLRMVERRNGIVASIITLRIQQALEFSNITHDKDVPGWELILKDNNKTLSSTQKKQKQFLEEFLSQTKVPDYEGLEPKYDDFKDLIIKFVRDRILIDKVCWEIERDNAGRALAIWVLDGATIFPIMPGGYYGSISQIGYGNHGYNKLADEIRKSKLEKVPELEEIAFVQELLYGTSGGGVVAAFRRNDLIYDLGNELNDIRLYKQGLSVTEKANTAIVAFINSLTFNSNGLSRGSIPKVAIAMGKDSNYTEDQLEDMQDEWLANFEAMDGQWNIPILNSDAKILNLLPNNRDMEYQKYMEFTGALICSIFGVDSSEIGLRLNQAQAVLSENQDGKQIFSKNRGLREMLGGFAYAMNKFLDKSGYDFAKDFRFHFNGLSTEDKGFESDLRKKNVETIKTVDEVRAEMDLPPLENDLGNIILNSVWLQNKQAAEMAEQGEGMEGEEGEETGFGDFSDDEMDDMVDEAMDGMEKAVKLI
jgi:hypothetical protein